MSWPAPVLLGVAEVGGGTCRKLHTASPATAPAPDSLTASPTPPPFLAVQMGDHLSALRLLALTLRDIAAAEAYATAHLPAAEYRTLLQLVLHPGPGVEPLYEDACDLITALGGCGWAASATYKCCS